MGSAENLVRLVADVRETVRSIPPGRVMSYGDIGDVIGVGARQVGRAMTLISDGVPWWRVVYADGTPATCHGGGAPDLLRSERTVFRGRRVDLRQARFQFS